MLRYMLDTNICIYTIKNKPETVRQLFTAHEGQMCISVVTHMELLFGAEKSQSPKNGLAVVEGFCARLDVLHYDQVASEQTAQIRAELGRQGTPIGPYDALIAGHARSQGLILVSNNLKEFSRVEGLRLINWLTSS